MGRTSRKDGRQERILPNTESSASSIYRVGQWAHSTTQLRSPWSARALPLRRPPRFSSRIRMPSQVFVPFKTIPSNVFAQGLTRIKKHPGIYLGAAGAGYGAGSMTEDPEKLAMASALMGPYAIPFLIGASHKAGARALHGVSPLPEWSLTKTFTEPWAPFTESPGRRWFDSADAKKERQAEKRRETAAEKEDKKPGPRKTTSQRGGPRIPKRKLRGVD
jgi:hypothetical protein